MKGNECPDCGKASVLHGKIYSCFSPSFTTAATIIFSLITYKTLATQEIEWIAGIYNHLGCFLLLGLHKVVYAGRPAGRPAGF
jgi:hypothetical protein